MKIRLLRLQKVLYDRADFISTINDIVTSIDGTHDHFDSYSGFIGYMKYHPANEILNDISIL